MNDTQVILCHLNEESRKTKVAVLTSMKFLHVNIDVTFGHKVSESEYSPLCRWIRAEEKFDMDEWGFPFITMLLLFSKKSEQKCQSSYFSVLFSMLLGYSLRSYDVSFDNSHFIWETRGVDDQKNFFLFNSLSQAPLSQSMAISDQNGTTIQSRSQLEWSTVIGFGVSSPERSTAAVSFSFLYHFILLCSITSLEDCVSDSSVPFICCLLPSANLFSIASWSKEHQRLTSTGYKTSCFLGVGLFLSGFEAKAPDSDRQSCKGFVRTGKS